MTTDREACWLTTESSKPRTEKLLLSLVGDAPMFATIRRLCQNHAAKFFVETAITDRDTGKSNVIIGTWTSLGKESTPNLGSEGYTIFSEEGRLWIVAEEERGLLYGFYHFLKEIQLGTPLLEISAQEKPANVFRMINHWDNMDGSVERGYAGRSLFFEGGSFTKDEDCMRSYAELLSSVGINALTINNVNVHEQESALITNRWLPEVAWLAKLFQEYGLTLFLSINYASPITIGGLDTADPLETSVADWWERQVERIYGSIPSFGGFVVKADSEHRPGPFSYGRTHADGANMLAKALKPYGGHLFWRCFVYDCLQDWRDRSTDRARAAYDHFAPLDGAFADNVILQIKSGPMDFQVREAVSPLIGALKQTKHVIELQITQEYTGQQIDVCYLPPQWKEILDFDTHANGKDTTVADLVSGRANGGFGQGMTAVVNTGRDENWTGHSFAQANLYGYGQLAWNPKRCLHAIAEEWADRTYPYLPKNVRKTIVSIQECSWIVYESYTSPLGIGWMVNPGHHYGPNVNGYEFSPWGTYHFSDRNGLGVDRTRKGSNYVSQYAEPVGSRYENLQTCPDELLLFFHHVPYTHVLTSGKTVIQHIYDSHFDGVEQVKAFIAAWESHKQELPEALYQHVRVKFDAQLANAVEWRDQVNTYYYRMSGIEDKHGRTIYR
ncbi:alpha-glucuronidase family glycosyl hydrolase [Desmospora activa]|uniref:alpha-glucuronidase family glycosyl hydrolase n=1 Tax=Desmospora activa TaxID=500615 RepID=UPI001FEC3C3B|nr:alpha-glucuronidase family glycosyl hydrolase [Desmospora activa]